VYVCNFAINALEYRNNFGIFEYGNVCSSASMFNFISVLLDGATTECWSWECGRIWSFSPLKGNTLNWLRRNFACKHTAWVYSCTPNLAEIGEGWVQEPPNFEILSKSQFQVEIWHSRTKHAKIWSWSVEGVGVLASSIFEDFDVFWPRKREVMNRFNWNYVRRSTADIYSFVTNFPLDRYKGVGTVSPEYVIWAVCLRNTSVTYLCCSCAQSNHVTLQNDVTYDVIDRLYNFNAKEAKFSWFKNPACILSQWLPFCLPFPPPLKIDTLPIVQCVLV